MPHECDACGETFTTLSRLRLHDCPEAESASQDPLSSFDAFLDSISDGLEADMQRNVQEREKRGLEAASETLKINLEAAAQGDVDAAFRLIAQYERELKKYHDAEDYDTYRGIFWAFYEPAAEALDGIATREGWDFLANLIDAYPRESSADEPLASPVIENAVGRHVVRTRLRDGVAAIPVEALAYLGSFWESMGYVSGEESFTYGWGIGHPEHSVTDHLHEVVTEELFWVRGVLPHTFYADQHAAADLLEALLTDERVDYEDRYMLASILATVDHDSTPKSPAIGIFARTWTTGSSGTRRPKRSCGKRSKRRDFTSVCPKTGRSVIWRFDYDWGPTSGMSKQVTVTLDDEDFEYATDMKEFLGLTWEEFMIEAAECFDAQIANGRVS